MSYKIDGIPITAETIANTYRKYYPTQFAASSKYNLVNLFGIRVSTSDTSKLDDFVGAIKLSSGYTSLDGYEMLVCKASTEPAPLYISKPFDYESVRKGGAAFLKEGQHIYYLITPRSVKPSWSDGGRNCAFCPTTEVPVYRFRPTQTDINLWRQKKQSISKNFEKNLIYANTSKKNQNGVPFLSTSTDTCIHKAWSETLYNDSAGCQVISPSDLPTFRNICNWAQQHLNKGYGNTFTYTLFTKEQFRTANIGSFDIASGIINLFRKLF
jgi:hypothetical protein